MTKSQQTVIFKNRKEVEMERDERYENMLFAIVDTMVMDYGKATCAIHNDEIGKARLSTRNWIKMKCMRRGALMYLEEVNSTYGLDIDPDYLIGIIDEDMKKVNYNWTELKKLYNKVV